MMSPPKEKFFMHTLSFGDEGVYHFLDPHPIYSKELP
jgi:hypothetical protein